jgi:hypothetical protein
VALRLDTTDARPLALFRIALGIVLLLDIVHHAWSLSTFYSDDGLFPRAAISPDSLSIFDLTGSPLGVGLIFAVGAAAALAFTLGLFTRTSAIVLWLVLVSRQHRVPDIHNGGDAIAAVLVFFSCFAEISARGSIDARRAPHGRRDRVPQLAPLLLQATPAVLYVATAWQKLADSGRSWLDGSVLYANLHLAGWARPGGVWLREHPTLCMVFGAGTIAAELAIPVLLAWSLRSRRARVVAIVLHLSLQLGILVTFKVGVFTNVMLATTALWLPSDWLDRVWPRIDAPLPPPGELTRVRRAIDAALASLFAVMALALFVPSPASGALRAAGLELNATLFTRAYASVRWEARGELDDGRVIDPLDAISGADFGDGVWNSLWMQLPYRLRDPDELARFMCRRTPALRHWTLARLVTPPYEPGAPASQPERTVVLDHGCRN